MITNETRWVLLAEDDADIRSLLRSSIEAEATDIQIEFVEAANGTEALNQSLDRQFHCVVTDLKMPGLSGEDLLRSLRIGPLNANTPTLVVSGFAHAQFMEEFSYIKVISKPFMPQAVAAAVLRELRLGRMDDRASLHLMNPFLATASTFVEDKLQLKVSQEAPAVKRSTEDLRGEIHCMLTLAAGQQTARFAFSFDRSLLKFAKTIYFQSQVAETVQLQPENVARLFAQVLAEQTLPALVPAMGVLPKVTRLSVITPRSIAEHNELVQSAGITVTLKTSQGNLYAGAFSRSKKK